MAYTKDNFLRDLAIFSSGGIAALERRRLAGFVGYALKKGISLTALGLVRGAPAAASIAAYNPALTGAALGLGALQTDPGQALLAASEESGRKARVRYERAVQDAIFGTQEKIKRATKKKVSNFNKAVSSGMSVVKTSKSFGKPGVISSAKKAFTTVTKTVAGLGKRKTPSKGIRRSIATTPAAKKYKDEILRRKMK